MKLFLSSGDLTADRRFEIARDLEARGDLAGAADLLSQAVELKPDFAAAWFALGALREKLADRTGAIEAFGNAHNADPQDRHGAGLRLVRLSAGEHPMTQAYVRSVYDQYAQQFDDALAGLSYRGPELLVSALEEVLRDSGRRMHFGTMLDLGCGTGLAGAALRPFVDWLVGIDLSEAMIAQARNKVLYDKLVVAELMEFLRSDIEAGAQYALVTAADVFIYTPDLTSVADAVARVLEPGGLFAFTVETHDGDGVILGDKLRYAHGETHVSDAIGRAGLTLRHLSQASKRNENNRPVSSLVVVAEC